MIASDTDRQLQEYLLHHPETVKMVDRMPPQADEALRAVGFQLTWPHRKCRERGDPPEALLAEPSTPSTGNNDLSQIEISVTPDPEFRADRWGYEISVYRGDRLLRDEAYGGPCVSWHEVLGFFRALKGTGQSIEPLRIEELVERDPNYRRRPLDLPFDQVRTFDMQYLEFDLVEQREIRPFLVRHPHRTATCDEKREMILSNSDLYGPYGDIRVAQGALLSYKDPDGKQRLVIHMQDAHSSDGEKQRINTKQLKKELGIPKKRDLRFYDGDMYLETGLAPGIVSPFVCSYKATIDAFHFDASLFEAEERQPGVLFDVAVNYDKSLLIPPSVLYDHLSRSKSKNVSRSEPRSPAAES